MNKLILPIIFLAPIANAQITLLDERPRYVTIEQTVCEQKEVLKESNGILGGILGAAIGRQVGKGSGKEAATVAGAIAGTNIARNRSDGKIVTKNVCHKEMVQVQRGKYVTMEYEGKVHTILVD